MEIVMIVIFLIIAYTKTIETEQKKLVKLPVGKNTEGFFDEKAFTQITVTLKEGKANAKKVG